MADQFSGEQVRFSPDRVRAAGMRHDLSLRRG